MTMGNSINKIDRTSLYNVGAGESFSTAATPVKYNKKQIIKFNEQPGFAPDSSYNANNPKGHIKFNN